MSDRPTGREAASAFRELAVAPGESAVEAVRRAIEEGDPDNRIYRAIRDAWMRRIARDLKTMGESLPERDVLQLVAEKDLAALGIFRHDEVGRA